MPQGQKNSDSSTILGGVKPMLAAQIDLQRVKYPVVVQPKYDGIRVIAVNGIAYSRSLKPIRNKYVQWFFKEFEYTLSRLDGELIVGEPTDPDVYRRTNSGVMSEAGEPDFRFYVFDLVETTIPYQERRVWIQGLFRSAARGDLTSPAFNRLWLVPDEIIRSEEELLKHKTELLQEGFEGAIVRGMDNLYKYGRSTAIEGSLLKFKDFLDAEAKVIDFQEYLHNDNTQVTSPTGYATRSSHTANMRAGALLGALVVHNPDWSVPFRIGTGFDMATRKEIWDNRDRYIHRTVKFKYLPVGVKDAPRHPVFLGFRDEIDQSE